MTNQKPLPPDLVELVRQLPAHKYLRWYLAVDGERIQQGKGFWNKEQASSWIDNLGRTMDWRAGFTFKIRGNNATLEIVDKHGKRANI